jgi:allantoinase
LRRLELTLHQFEVECADTVRVLALGLHPHLIAVPHRVHELQKMIALLASHPKVLFTTGSAIFDWYQAANPAGGV